MFELNLLLNWLLLGFILLNLLIMQLRAFERLLRRFEETQVLLGRDPSTQLLHFEFTIHSS
jgi:hypothetical protein